MNERHVLDAFLDPIQQEAVADEDAWAMGLGAREIARGEILPAAAAMESEGAVRDDIVKLMATNGFFGIGIPEQYGGMGLGVNGSALVAAEVGYAHGPSALVAIVTESLAAKAIEILGNEKQKELFLPKLASGEQLGCYALTGPEGSNFSRHMSLLAERRGGSFVLNGEKMFITEADRADIAVVFARDRDQQGRTGYYALIVPNAAKGNGGYRVERKEDKPGLRSSSTCTMAFRDVEVPEELLLGIGTGREAESYARGLQTLNSSRPTIAAKSIGIAKRALAYALQYAAETVRGGNDHIIDKPLVHTDAAGLIADLGRDLAFLHAAARAIDKRGLGDLPARLHSSMAKAHGTSDAIRAAQEAMGIIGGAAYSSEHPVAGWLNDLYGPWIYEGQERVQRYIAGSVVQRMLEPLRPTHLQR